MDREKATQPVFQRELTKGNYRRLMKRLGGGVLFVKVATGEILDGNPSFFRMFGHSKDFLLRFRFRDLFPVETFDKIETGLKGKSRLLSEIPCRKGDGTNFYADLQIVRFQSYKERLIQVIFTNVTERKVLRDRLRENLEEKEKLAEAQSELVINLDPQGKILSANRSAFEALGYGKGSLIGREPASLFPPDKEKEILEVLTRAFAGETVRGFDTEFVGKNGQHRNVRLDLVPIAAPDSKTSKRVILLGYDATKENKLVHELTVAKEEVEELYNELRDAYQELKETQDELVHQEKLAATGELAAAVAHEIRNPLSIINMSVQYIHGKLGPENVLREFTEAIIEKVDRVDRITKELINYGRPRELALRMVDIQRVLDSVLRLAAARARSQRVETHRIFSRYLPQVKVDVERMDEVFSNLITNALDAMPEGGHLTVVVKEAPDQKRVLVEIVNTGKGISPRVREQLFAPFFTTKPAGTGLGLAICQRIVSEHHGSIAVETKISGPNKGTRFIVTLPIASAEKEPSLAKTADEPLLTPKAV